VKTSEKAWQTHKRKQTLNVERNQCHVRENTNELAVWFTLRGDSSNFLGFAKVNL